MIINKTLNEKELTIEIEGILDTTTAPKLETELKQNYDDITLLVIDLKKLDYISSAGLRVLLLAQKVMNKQGKLIIKNVNETVMEIFEVTNFVQFLTIE